jgi:hypothetical protein
LGRIQDGGYENGIFGYVALFLDMWRCFCGLATLPSIKTKRQRINHKGHAGREISAENEGPVFNGQPGIAIASARVCRKDWLRSNWQADTVLSDWTWFNQHLKNFERRQTSQWTGANEPTRSGAG